MNTAVVKKEENSPMVMDFDAYAGTGSEGVEGRDRKIPLLRIAEALSKCLMENEDKFIEGAKKGDIIDSSLNISLGTSISFLPVQVECVYYEWQDEVPVNKHPNSDILAKCEWRGEKGSKKGHFLENGNEIQKTFVFYGINLSNGNSWVSIPMSRARLSAADTFLNRLEAIKNSRGQMQAKWFKVWELSSKDAMSKDGKPYKTWDAKPVEELMSRDDAQELFTQAASFYEILIQGSASVDLDQMSEKDIIDNDDGSM